VAQGNNMIHWHLQKLYRVIQKEVYTLKKFILQKLLILNPCPVYGWKGNLSKF
jgi:hypothetical protein